MAMDTGAVTTAIITTITAVVAVTITATTMTTMMTTEERAKERVDPMTMTTMEDVAGVTTMVVGTTTATSKASSKRCARIRLLLPPSSLRVKCPLLLLLFRPDLPALPALPPFPLPPLEEER